MSQREIRCEVMVVLLYTFCNSMLALCEAQQQRQPIGIGKMLSDGRRAAYGVQEQSNISTSQSDIGGVVGLVIIGALNLL